jgi:ribosomal subunit interface protein
MEIRVSGRGVEVGTAFKDHATQRLQAISDKYFSRALSSLVTLGHEAHGYGFHVDCTMHIGQGVVLKAEGKGNEAHGALDGAADRIEKQLRRYKRRLKNHHPAGDREVAIESADYSVVEHNAEEDDVAEGDNPVIIAETKTNIPTVCVSDAVMLMDLAHAPALMFRNGKAGSLSMVYRRADGHIGWVDSGQK